MNRPLRFAWLAIAAAAISACGGGGDSGQVTLDVPNERLGLHRVLGMVDEKSIDADSGP